MTVHFQLNKTNDELYKLKKKLYADDNNHEYRYFTFKVFRKHFDQEKDRQLQKESRQRFLKKRSRLRAPTEDLLAERVPEPKEVHPLEKLTVPELKQMLRDRNLKVSGKKTELIERLK